MKGNLSEKTLQPDRSKEDLHSQKQTLNPDFREQPTFGVNNNPILAKQDFYGDGRNENTEIPEVQSQFANKDSTY